MPAVSGVLSLLPESPPATACALGAHRCATPLSGACSRVRRSLLLPLVVSFLRASKRGSQVRALPGASLSRIVENGESGVSPSP